MQILEIRSTPPSQPNLPLGTITLDYDALRHEIASAADLNSNALDRLIRRLRAGFPVILPLRPEANPEPLVTRLIDAGANVVLGAPPKKRAARAAAQRCRDFA